MLVRVFVHQYDWTHVALRALSNCDSIAGDCLDFSLTTTVSQQGSTCFNLMISHLVWCVCVDDTRRDLRRLMHDACVSWQRNDVLPSRNVRLTLTGCLVGYILLVCFDY